VLKIADFGFTTPLGDQYKKQGTR